MIITENNLKMLKAQHETFKILLRFSINHSSLTINNYTPYLQPLNIVLTVASIQPVLISPRKAGTNVTASLVFLGMEKHVLVSFSKIFQLVK